MSGPDRCRHDYSRRSRTVSRLGRLDIASCYDAIGTPIHDSGSEQHEGEEEPRVDEERRKSAKAETGREEPSAAAECQGERTRRASSSRAGTSPLLGSL